MLSTNPFYLLRTLWTGRNAPILLLLMFVSAFIWWIGPKLPPPFNSYVVRSIIITVLLGGFAAIVAWRKRRARKNSDELMEAVVQPDESKILRERFKAAIKTLKTAQKAGRKGLTELPWYIIIGPPGSGKTTLLRNAGLNFPIEDDEGSIAVRGVGGTRDCDWWFADEAVLLDTAGRYTTQDSDEAVDRKAWTAFLDLLKGRRRKRPINGILVAFGADTLLSANEDQLRHHAGLIRKRVLELYTRLNGRFPIYLMITKIDLVPGFIEFFEALSAAEREQVWGYTQQIIKATGDVSKINGTFDGEFELLLKKLSLQMLDRIRDESDHKRRSLILAFPEQLAQARHRMRLLVTQGFAPNAYQENLLLRGLYMTSGTQEGAPIDRLMGGLARAMNVDPLSVRQTTATGRSYFIKDLLRKVVFREQDLLGIGYRQAQRRRRIQIGAYAGIVIAAALALIGWTYIYIQERNYVTTAEASLRDYQNRIDPSRDLSAEFSERARAVVVRLDRLVAARDEVAASDPTATSFGLPGNRGVLDSVNGAYYNQLNVALAPLIVDNLTARLQRRDGLVQQITAFNTAEVNLLSLYVRSYGAYEDPRRRLRSDIAKADFLDTILYDMELRDPAITRSLRRHVEAYVFQPGGIKARGIERTVMQGARESLAIGGDGLGSARSAYADWVFRNLRTSSFSEVDSDTNRRPGLVDQIGSKANDVFRRRTGRDLNEPIPAIYTREGFERFFETDLDEILDAVKRDSWVYLGDDDQGYDRRAAKEAITSRYVNDYINFWLDLISDVGMRQANRAEVLRDLSRPPSPFKTYINIIANNTQLVGPDDNKVRRIGPIRLGGGSGARSEPTPAERVTEVFSAVGSLISLPSSDGGEAVSPKIDAVTADIRTLANESAALLAGDPSIGTTEQEKRKLGTLARDLESVRLDQIIREILGSAEDIRVKGDIETLGNAYKQGVLPNCRSKIAGRYPFSSNYSRQVGLRDLEDLFGQNGEMTQFIRDEIYPLIDRANGGWKWKPEIRDRVQNAGALYQFELADRIRRAFFANGSAQSVFDMTPHSLADGTSRARLQVGANVSDFYGQQPLKEEDVRWPAGVVRLELYGAGNREAVLEPKGDWAMFRLLEQALATQSQNGGTSLLATFGDSALSGTFRFETDSVDNPFNTFSRWRQFRCPSQLLVTQ